MNVLQNLLLSDVFRGMNVALSYVSKNEPMKMRQCLFKRCGAFYTICKRSGKGVKAKVLTFRTKTTRRRKMTCLPGSLKTGEMVHLLWNFSRTTLKVHKMRQYRWNCNRIVLCTATSSYKGCFEAGWCQWLDTSDEGCEKVAVKMRSFAWVAELIRRQRRRLHRMYRNLT